MKLTCRHCGEAIQRTQRARVSAPRQGDSWTTWHWDIWGVTRPVLAQGDGCGE